MNGFQQTLFFPPVCDSESLQNWPLSPPFPPSCSSSLCSPTWSADFSTLIWINWSDNYAGNLVEPTKEIRPKLSWSGPPIRTAIIDPTPSGGRERGGEALIIVAHIHAHRLGVPRRTALEPMSPIRYAERLHKCKVMRGAASGVVSDS